jgi:hypothetical protein
MPLGYLHLGEGQEALTILYLVSGLTTDLNIMAEYVE